MTPSWFDLLVCPISKTPLRYDSEHQLLIAETSGKAYPVRDGIPVLLAEEALDWSPETGVKYTEHQTISASQRPLDVEE